MNNNNIIYKYAKKIKKIFKIIKKKTNSKIEIKLKINKEVNIKIKNKNIENINFKKNILLNIISYLNGKKCNIILNNLNKKNIKKCINYINNTINYISIDKNNDLPNKNIFIKKQKKKLGIYFKDDINIKKMINILKNIEKNSINLNKNIIVDNTIFNKYKNIYIIYNDYKKIKIYKCNYYLIIHDIIIKYKNIIESDTIYLYRHKLLDILKNYKYLSKKITKNINIKIKQKNIKTNKYSVIFNNEISSEILEYLYYFINGKNIYNKISYLYKKLNKKIFPKWINIIENPYLYKGIGTKPFDNEGLNTKKYYIIKHGILKTWILNSYYSKKLKKKNTFNSGGIHNWVIINKKNNISFKKLIKLMNNGIIIDKFLGEGLNINSGLYSKGISGYLVKKGKIKYYINEATISGNLINLYKNIKNISNDVNNNSKIKTGSILINNINITGNKK